MDELCHCHFRPEVPEQLTCWPLKTGTKMKQLVLLGTLEVHAEVVDASQEGVQARASTLSAQFDTYVFGASC